MPANIHATIAERKAAEKVAYAKYKAAAEAAFEHSLANDGEPNQSLEMKKLSLGRIWTEQRESIRDLRVLAQKPEHAR